MGLIQALGLAGTYKAPAATPTSNLKPAAQAGGQTLPYPGYLSPQQMASDAQAQAEAALAPARSAIQSQMQQSQQYATARAAIISALYKQLAGMQQPLAGQVQGIYSGAAHDQTAFAKGYSDALQQALGQNTGAINSQLSLIGAPAGQMQSGAPAEAAGNVLYGLGGAIPAQTMTREGAAFASAAALMPSSTFGRGILDVRAMLNQEDANQQKLQAQLDTLAASEPDLVNKATATLQEAQSQAAQLAATGKYQQQQLSLRKYQIDTTNYLKKLSLNQASKKDAFNAYVAQKKLGLSEQNQSFNQWAKTQGLRIQGQRVSLQSQSLALAQQKAAAADARAAAKAGQTTWRPVPSRPGYFYNPQNPSQIYKASQIPGGVNANGTVARKATAGQLKSAGSLARDAWLGVTLASGKNPPSGAWVKTADGKYHLQYEDAMSELLAQGVPLLAAQNALNRYWTKAGQDGRPQYSYQQRQTRGSQAATLSTTPTGARQVASSLLSQYGWGQSQFSALEKLWDGESGWNYKALNPSSGAAGIPQALGHKLPADYATNPLTQIKWGLAYIRARYGSPTRALAFKQANNWY